MRLQVFEHEVIRYQGHSKNEGFEKPHFLSLCDFHDASESFKFYSIVRDGIRFNQHVGVISVGNLTIEILPKTDQSGDRSVWQDVLIKMLQETRNLPIQCLSYANLKLQSNNILDLYFEIFLKEVSAILRAGLIKRYRRKEENGTALRGALHISKHIQKNIIHKERFYVKRQVYDVQELLNCIIRKTLDLMFHLSLSSNAKSMLSQQSLNFPEFPDIAVEAKTFDKIKWDRKNLRYRTCIDIARIILLNYHPDISKGRNNVLAILFDMNALWEKFIFGRLKKSISKDVNIYSQASTAFWESKKVRPDIFLELGNQKMILDTKWKILKDAQPSDDDLKQIFVYNQYFKCNKGILLYPSVGQISKEGTYHHGGSKCVISFINILDEQAEEPRFRLSPRIGERLIEVIGFSPEN